MEQFEHGIDWTRTPQLAHNFDMCTVRAIVKKATEKRGRDTDPGGVLLGIFGGSVPPGSSNPDPISKFRPKKSFSTPVFRPDL